MHSALNVHSFSPHKQYFWDGTQQNWRKIHRSDRQIKLLNADFRESLIGFTFPVKEDFLLCSLRATKIGLHAVKSEP